MGRTCRFPKRDLPTMIAEVALAHLLVVPGQETERTGDYECICCGQRRLFISGDWLPRCDCHIGKHGWMRLELLSPNSNEAVGFQYLDVGHEAHQSNDKAQNGTSEDEETRASDEERE